MEIDRIRTARVGIPLILGADAAFILLVGFEEAVHPAVAGGFQISTVFWALVIAGIFVAPAWMLLNGRGVERGDYARALAWMVGLAVPLCAFVLYALSWGGSSRTDPMDIAVPTVLFSVVHMLIPALVRWARDEGSLSTLWFRSSRAMLGASALMLFMMFGPL